MEHTLDITSQFSHLFVSEKHRVALYLSIMHPMLLQIFGAIITTFQHLAEDNLNFVCTGSNTLKGVSDLPGQT